MSGDRLPSLPLPPPGQAYSGTSSPRVSSIASSIGSSIGSHSGSQSSYTSVASSHGPKTPSPTLPINAITGPSTTIPSYDAMNGQGAPEMYYSQHMSGGQAPAPQTVTSGAMSHYTQQQPPLLPPGHAAAYSTPSYSHYPYAANGLTSPPPAQPTVSNPMAPQNVLPLPGAGNQNPMQNQYTGFDTTGQQPPPGMKPRVTATLWEDEGSLCFQVEARGICVARREDNHMINGTKLLNVAGMTRGRRDGILKSEKVRHVVKIGPMHLKGVWIPYDRALDFANKEKITELLYPLFVHNIGALLYHPANQSRTTQVMAAAERRKQEANGMRNPGHPGLPSINHHQPMPLPGPQTQLPSHSMGRPSLDRAHTFPTPPTSASSVMGNMGASDSFNWQGQGMNGAQGTNPMTIETGLNNTRSMPNTPATTPPGNSLQSMQNYASGNQTYDGTRPMYNPQSHQSPYQASAGNPQDRIYGQTSTYPKNDMAPPASRPSASEPSAEQQDTKPPNGMLQSDQPPQQHTNEDEGDHEHDAEYTHDSGAYDGSRNNYNYTAPSVGALTNDANLSTEMSGSPSLPPPSGRATPRTTAPAQSYYNQHTGYNTPPRVQQTSSSLYNVIGGNDRGAPNGAPGNDVYAPAADMSGLPNGYAQPPVMNGAAGVLKRGRDDDDDLSRSGGNGPNSMGSLDLKRRKTMMETTVPAPAYDAMTRPASAVGAPRRQ
ncbi:Cell pattern formation-associated protein STUA [Fusarium keratoplasticum]|uniref:Cell pattern formation-associated protein STUA n=1 Tax=Fusarium keratoplasticum TaxID=1328300 RepID=A0ACC0QX47_9HYPO|nr:Cell pattern formation-associated protein STUA [Fusarium keratoplasticum]KAI8669329.1 Cell pattern formation-associated protein STUA [Fusarium keratoplasticum]KAI8673932.1 Cell pattern formation-associated protein STUA [Fusarium keratoplasticum]